VEVGPLPPGSYGIWLGGERVGAFEVSAGDVKRVRLDLPTNDEP
jgi:hypothetical protein